MAASVRPFLMFEGHAEEAMNFYVSLFADGRIEEITRYGANQPGKEGSVQLARFSVAGQSIMCIDSPARHAFTFTPSVSLFITCEDEAEFGKLTGALVEGGAWLMPPDNYGFSRRFGWCNDRFGVSWQINLP
jgi:predicted 3-demethylubiquinone-9 3-methyltransferase (glyoxalase superfamily)